MDLPLLDHLEHENVFKIRELNNGNFRVWAILTERHALLTPVELLRLSNELMDLALNAIDPEG
jgi:hypothetical protein